MNNLDNLLIRLDISYRHQIEMLAIELYKLDSVNKNRWTENNWYNQTFDIRNLYRKRAASLLTEDYRDG